MCIETGTDICSVGLVQNGELISLRESDSGRDHAKKVATFVDEILKLNNIQPEEIDAVAVGEGPGSYTGLRIGVSFAKGLCYGTGKPLIAVSSLAAWDEATLCPMIDARRMEVYTQLFDSKGAPLTAISAEVVTEQSFADVRSSAKNFVIFGSGAAKCSETLGATLVDITPSVRGMARIAENKYNSREFVDVAYFEPYYLKDFVVTTSKKNLLAK